MTDLRERLKAMGDKYQRHKFDIGHYWNAVEESLDEIEAQDAAIQERDALLKVLTDQQKRDTSTIAALRREVNEVKDDFAALATKRPQSWAAVCLGYENEIDELEATITDLRGRLEKEKWENEKLRDKYGTAYGKRSCEDFACPDCFLVDTAHKEPNYCAAHAALSEAKKRESLLLRLVDSFVKYRTGRVVAWSSAGGPNECKHGFAAGLVCIECTMAEAHKILEATQREGDHAL